MPNKDILKRRQAWTRWYEKHKSDQIVISKKKARDIAKQTNFENQNCSIKGCEEIGERHHPSYDKPKEIVWLCKTHHELIHSKDKCRLCEKPHRSLGLCYNHWRQERRKKFGYKLYR